MRQSPVTRVAMAATLLLIVVSLVRGQVVGTDYASNYGSWTDGSNAGTGFGAWTFRTTTPGGNAGFFKDTVNGDDNIRVLGAAFGMFANNGGTNIQEATAFRPFANPLAIGQSFHLTMDNAGNIEGSNPKGSVGFTLRTGNTTTNAFSYGSGSRMEFSFVGGDAQYSIFDGASSPNSSGIGFTGLGLRTNFVRTGANSYNLFVRDLNSNNVFSFINRTLGGTSGGALDSLALFVRNRGSVPDSYYNSLEVIGTAGFEWDGGGGNDNQSTGANWVGDISPIDGDTLVFAGATRLTPNIDVIKAVQAISFKSGASGFTIGGNALSVAAGIANNSTSAQRINNNLTLLADQTFDAGSAGGSGALQIAGTVNTNAKILTWSGANNGSISAAISGSGSIVKTGTGILELTSANSYTGGTTVNQGVLRVSNATALNTGAVTVTGATLEIAGVTIATTVPNLTLNNGATLRGTGAASYSKTNFPSIANGANVTLTTATATDTLTISSAIRNGDSSSLITVNGPGTVVLGGASTAADSYGGSWIVNGTSTTLLRLSAQQGLGNPNGTSPRPITITSGQFGISAGTPGSTPIPNLVTLSGGSISSITSAREVSGNVTLSPSTTSTVSLVDAINGTSARDMTFSGTLSGTGNLIVSGNTTGGTLFLTGGAGANAAGNVQLQKAATLSMSTSATFASLGDGSPGTGNTVLNGATVTLTTGAQSSTYSGVISGAGSLIKSGAGVFTLAGATHTYSGTTSASGGVILVNGSLGNPGGAVTVGNGSPNTGILGGSGTVSRAVNINNGGSISPGSGQSGSSTTLANFTINTGALTLAPGGTWVVELNRRADAGVEITNWDKLTLSSLTVTADSSNKFTVKVVGLDNGYNVAAVPGWNPAVGQTWRVATVSGSVTGFNTSAFNIDLSQFTNNNAVQANFYLWQNGGDINLTYVPEPSALAAVLTGWGLLLRRRRSMRD